MEREEWRRRRAAFCHDWLKNQFLPALRATVNCLDGQVDDPDIERTFFGKTLWLWPEMAPTAQELIDSFERTMSPASQVRRWIAGLPEASRADWLWLESVSHALWLARNDVPAVVGAASAAMKIAEYAFSRVQSVLASGRPEPVALRNAVVSLGDNLQVLSGRLSAFPDEGRSS